MENDINFFAFKSRVCSFMILMPQETAIHTTIPTHLP